MRAPRSRSRPASSRRWPGPLFDAGRYARGRRAVRRAGRASPDNDYARFGLGLTRMRLGDVAGAVEQLAMAAAMRPGRQEYQQALREARATLRPARTRPAGRRRPDDGGRARAPGASEPDEADGDARPLAVGTPQPLVERHDVALLDLDGVLYVGPDAVPGAPEALADSARGRDAAGVRHEQRVAYAGDRRRPPDRARASRPSRATS